MAKFLHILAASVGGGLVLGAGIRLGEVICGSGENKGAPRRREADGADSALAGVVERMDRQQREMEAMRQQISDTTRALDSTGMGRDLRGELRRELAGELDRRLAAVEESLHRSLDTSNREAVESMVSTIEKRLAPRIARLETELSGQSASVAELREYALQSERSILRLLTALEKTMGTKQDEADSPRLSVVR